ncbi:MAG: thrombospondin type 3 repeat-containing protein [Candidatus Saccharimonadales bacterium]
MSTWVQVVLRTAGGTSTTLEMTISIFQKVSSPCEYWFSTQKLPDPILDEQVPVAACGVSIPDSDGDGVTDEKDNCPNTPAGTTVDANGCPVVEPTPNPTVSVTPTGTPTVEPTVVPTPTVTPTQPAPQPQAVKGLKVKVKKAKVKATWKSATATKWQCKTKVVKGTKVKPKKRTVTSAQCTFKVKVKTKKAKVKISVREIGGPYKTKTVKLSA